MKPKKLKKAKLNKVEKLDKKLVFPPGGGSPEKGNYQMVCLALDRQAEIIEAVNDLSDKLNEVIDSLK